MRPSSLRAVMAGKQHLPQLEGGHIAGSQQQPVQERGAAARVADDEDRPVDRLLAVARVDQIIEAERRRRDRLAHLQKRERAERPQPKPEGLADHPVEVQVAPHSALPHRGGAHDGEPGCGAGDRRSCRRLARCRASDGNRARRAHEVLAVFPNSEWVCTHASGRAPSCARRRAPRIASLGWWKM